MTTLFLPMSTDAQSNLTEVICEYDDHESHGAYGGTHILMVAMSESPWPSLAMKVFVRLILNDYVVHASSPTWYHSSIF
jgi:hypothetical protein